MSSLRVRCVWRPTRMLKKSASCVLASLKDSTYRSVRLAFSLAAALLDSLFEPPEPATLLHDECSRFAGQGATDILGIGDQSGLPTPFYEFDHGLNFGSHAASIELIVRIMFLCFIHGHTVQPLPVRRIEVDGHLLDSGGDQQQISPDTTGQQA